MATLPSSVLTRSSVREALLIAVGAGVIAAALVFALTRDLAVAVGFVGAALLIGGGVVAWRRLAPSAAEEELPVDWNVVRAVADLDADALAVTDRAGRLVCANDRYGELFAGLPTPPGLPLDDRGIAALGQAGRAAWRDGHGAASGLALSGGALGVEVLRAGAQDDVLVWRFSLASSPNPVAELSAALAGAQGDRLGAAGIMAAVATPDGRLIAANRVLAARAGIAGPAAGADLAELLHTDERGQLRFVAERSGNPLRLIQVPFADAGDAGEGQDSTPVLLALLDEEEAPGQPSSAAGLARSLVAMMPVGIALVDREGRFAQMNDAFARAAGVDPVALPLYPGDLVVREDKGAVADAVRRFAGGATHKTDIAVRLKGRPDEPVVLTIAGARGLGDAAVLLSLKDNSEESRLKRQAEQATKMQAVGQLAGGVAHDFNNILTAIIGHCDLMLMRHSPGDSDYDDIQQVRHNSDRAAGLTRQLLAFSRQQTLRPQVLQLPDVVSEVSNLLKRLLGETVTLDVHHGRGLGAVRADPGQLGQVVMNLAVNARDAMTRDPQDKGGAGGTLTIQTRAVSAADVRRLGNDIMPIGDYTALEVSDTGVGIPADVLPKIFEPFFTTKEVGKGTGLGLSTVYGIVKQSEGYIFADSRPGEGATFTIYLPVHNAPVTARPAKPVREKPAASWGTGTVLVVEDEAMVRAVAERALVRQGYTVLTAENGEAALELLRTGPKPDLLVSDVVMPVMDGPTMARAVRERWPELPILFMSGYAEEQLRRSIDLDNVAFLPKPFSVQQLADAARDALSPR
ncbi:response regulator [uncultured Sphingomonas sp.]|uniref:response regulator n=1 Tax=uncultured Sphingomonas sp. TaxID=158754 RepID=UPI0035CB0BED